MPDPRTSQLGPFDVLEFAVAGATSGASSAPRSSAKSGPSSAPAGPRPPALLHCCYISRKRAALLLSGPLRLCGDDAVEGWSHRGDSNPRPAVYESAASVSWSVSIRHAPHDGHVLRSGLVRT